MQMATTYSVCLITYSFVVRFSIRVSISIHRSLISRTAPSSLSTRLSRWVNIHSYRLRLLNLFEVMERRRALRGSSFPSERLPAVALVPAQSAASGIAAAASSSASSTRGGDMGSRVMRMPIASATAFVIAPIGGTMGVSPTPRTP